MNSLSIPLGQKTQSFANPHKSNLIAFPHDSFRSNITPKLNQIAIFYFLSKDEMINM